jgi:3-hydroxyacyl-CoA dehydrogenase
MKKKLIYTPLSFLSILALLQFGCDSDNDSKEACEKFNAPEECKTKVQATSCCDDSQNCYYLYEDKKYKTPAEVVKVMCPNLGKEKTQALLSEMAIKTARLIEEAKISVATCN